MKVLRIIIIMIMCFEFTLSAQNFSKDFGKIGAEEADLAYYAPDKTAEAVILFDIGKSYFSDNGDGFKVVFEKETRIKIFTEAGLKWAEVKIPIYHEGMVYEGVTDLEACTYNVTNGIFKATPFNPADMHEEKINEFWSAKKFALPDVKPGSIIQYRYKIISEYKFNLRSWEFQSRIPTVYSEYEVSMIPFYEYVYLLQGTRKFDSQTSHVSTDLARRYGPIDFQDMVYNYVLKNVPAFKDEEYITSIDDYLIKLDFQLARVTNTSGVKTDIISTWPDLIKAIEKDPDVGKFANKCEKLSSKLISPESLAGKSQKEKFDFILNYVKNNFSWNKNFGKYASKSPGDLIKDKIGNDADLNLLTIGLLNAAGIEAYPLLISTRDNGKIKADYPFLKFFDYLIVFATVDGKNVLSDATEILCPNNRIPSRCLNDKGLLVKEGDIQWIGLQSLLPSEVRTEVLIDSIGETSHSTRTISATDYDALKLRTLYGSDKKKIAEREDANTFTVDDSSIVVLNPDEKEKAYILKYAATYKTEIINNKIYVAPFLDEPLAENPLKQYSRTYPIDMIYPVKRTYTSVIQIPGGYKVEFIPENYKFLNDSFELNYNIQNDGKNVSITFDYFFKKPVYNAGDYQNIKFYFKDIIRKGNEKIVLVHI